MPIFLHIQDNKKKGQYISKCLNTKLLENILVEIKYRTHIYIALTLISKHQIIMC